MTSPTSRNIPLAAITNPATVANIALFVHQMVNLQKPAVTHEDRCRPFTIQPSVSANFRRFIGIREPHRQRFQHIQRRNQPLHHAELVSDDNETAARARRKKTPNRLIQDQAFPLPHHYRRRKTRRIAANVRALPAPPATLRCANDTDNFIQLAPTYREQAMRRRE